MCCSAIRQGSASACRLILQYENDAARIRKLFGGEGTPSASARVFPFPQAPIPSPARFFRVNRNVRHFYLFEKGETLYVSSVAAHGENEFFIITNSPAGVMPCGAVALLSARMAETGILPRSRYRGTFIWRGRLRRRNADSPDKKFSGEGWGAWGEGRAPFFKGALPSPRQSPTSCTGRAGTRRLPRRDARIPRRSCLRGRFREAAARACWQTQAGAARRRMPGMYC